MRAGKGHERGELTALTALRFSLALYALLYHVLSAWNPSLTPRSWPLAGVVSAGYVAVNGFFVLSGFVLAYTYGGHERLRARSFFQARFARVYPMHVVGMGLAAVVLFARARWAPGTGRIGEELSWELVVVGLLLQAWIPSRALDLNGPMWSLSVEALFYALFPVLLRALAPRRTGTLVTVLVFSLGLAIVPALVHPVAFIPGVSVVDRVVLFNPLIHLPELVAGMAAGLVFLQVRPSGDRWRVVAAGTLLLLFLVLTESSAIPVGLLHGGLLDPFVVVLVFALAAGWPPSSRVPGFAVLGPLGRASYSLYVLHKPLYLALAMVRLGRSVPSPAFIIVYVVLAILLSVATWALVEEPLRRRLRPR